MIIKYKLSLELVGIDYKCVIDYLDECVKIIEDTLSELITVNVRSHGDILYLGKSSKNEHIFAKVKRAFVMNSQNRI